MFLTPDLPCHFGTSAALLGKYYPFVLVLPFCAFPHNHLRLVTLTSPQTLDVNLQTHKHQSILLLVCFHQINDNFATMNQAMEVLPEAALCMQCVPPDSGLVSVCEGMYVLTPPPASTVPMALRCGFGTGPLLQEEQANRMLALFKGEAIK